MKRRFGFIVLGLGLVWACGDDEKPPPPGGSPPDDAGEGGEAGSGTSGSGTGGSNPGGSSGRGGGGQGGTSSGAGGADDTGGGAGDGPGGAGSSGTGGIPPCESTAPPTTLTALCNPEGTIGAPMQVQFSDGAGTLFAVTPDELTIAWYAGTVMGDTFYVADRASAADTFSPGELRPAPVVAFSPDGLRLVELSSDGRTFTETTRTARGVAFGSAATEGSFATLNADADSQGLTFSGCVISPDDRTLFYLASDGQGDQPLRVSSRTGTGPWPVGSPISGCEFQSHGDLVSQPTGVSADGLTLFFFDWARGQARAAWRSTADGTFEWFTDLGARENAQPNAACDRLYYTSPSGPAFSAIE